MRVIVNGGMGRMGRLCALEFLADHHDVVIVDPRAVEENNADMEARKSFDAVDGRVDCILDVSSPIAVMDTVATAIKLKCPLVIGTTGLGPAAEQAISEASKVIPILAASNLSPGVLVLNRVARMAAKMLADYDIEVVEGHHRNKVDAPSGTALSLATSLADVTGRNAVFNRRGKRLDDEIGIASVRGGGLVGEHQVMFLGDFDSLTITHRAFDRKVLAKGAVFFTKLLVEKGPGLWSVDDLI